MEIGGILFPVNLKKMHKQNPFTVQAKGI